MYAHYLDSRCFAATLESGIVSRMHVRNKMARVTSVRVWVKRRMHCKGRGISVSRCGASRPICLSSLGSMTFSTSVPCNIWLDCTPDVMFFNYPFR